MSRKIESGMKDHDAVIFYGGDAVGQKIQITTKELKVGEDLLEQVQIPGFIQLDGLPTV